MLHHSRKITLKSFQTRNSPKDTQKDNNNQQSSNEYLPHLHYLLAQLETPGLEKADTEIKECGLINTRGKKIQVQ